MGRLPNPTLVAWNMRFGKANEGFIRYVGSRDRPFVMVEEYVVNEDGKIAEYKLGGVEYAVWWG
jgi:hypothetical protein